LVTTFGALAARSCVRRRRGVALLVGALVVAVVAGCKPKAGSSCKGNDSTCFDKQTALVCRGPAFVEVPCAGPTGCARFKNQVACDTTVATAGAACMGEDDEYACTADQKRALLCKSGRFEPYLECRGKGGCVMQGRKPVCDTSVAARGDPCKAQGATACSEDQKQMLICQGGKFELHRHCRGKNGCFEKAEALACDDTLSLAGDPCATPGQTVCSVDGELELICQQGIFTRSMACRHGCTVTNRAGRPIECK
jgi:hypothetical protein